MNAGLAVLIVFLSLPVAWFFYILQRRQRAIKAITELKGDAPAIHRAIEEFESLLSGGTYISNFQYIGWKSDFKQSIDAIPSGVRDVITGDPFQKALIRLLEYVEKGRALINENNKKVADAEADKLQATLKKRGIPFNRDQLLAAVSEEDNTLVVAGAGTGKTTTILGKVAYLIDHLGVSPSEILLLSFTGKAVEELQSRIERYFPNVPVTVKTFHSFGLSVMGKALGARPSIAFENTADRQRWIQKEFEALLKEHPHYLRAAVHYFAFYMYSQNLEPKFATLDEYYRYIKTEQIYTFQKELVKSQQEAMIANFLFLHNIRYEYERDYEIQTADQDHRQYKPDFFLPDYGIYLEHFGVDRAGNVHFVEDESKNVALSAKYRADMQWKRELHQKNATHLVETFSYEFSDGNWQEKLVEKLKQKRVVVKQRPMSEVLEMLREGGHMYQIINLFLTFLDLAKANHYKADDLESTIARRNRPREIAFSSLFLSIYRKYEEYLRAMKSIDFHDMLNEATKLIQDGKSTESFKYIIIDEFQDFSVSKNLLIQALCKKNPATKLFCVGDDWQAIFRFAGSDVSLMTNFEKHHGFTNHRQLVKTNRFDSKLATITNEFILKNPYQIKKNISAAKEMIQNPLEIIVAKSINDKGAMLAQVLEPLEEEAKGKGTKLSVMLLGRYTFNEPDFIGELKRTYRNLDIGFYTIHRSKGSEADYVIVLDVVEGKYGFPANIADDPILEIVLSANEPFPHAEERRLMYVALTRTRQKVYVFTQSGQVSPFILELDGDIKKARSGMTCPACSGAAVERTSKYGTFYGCSNFPQCSWTKNLERK